MICELCRNEIREENFNYIYSVSCGETFNRERWVPQDGDLIEIKCCGKLREARLDELVLITSFILDIFNRSVGDTWSAKEWAIAEEYVSKQFDWENLSIEEKESAILGRRNDMRAFCLFPYGNS